MGKLEDISLWVRYKSDVWLEVSSQTTVVHNVMRVLRGVRNVPNMVYASSSLTSGKLLYDRILESGKDSPDLRRSVMNDNYQQAWEFVDMLQKSLPYPVIFPSDVTPIHQEWEQKHFMALWLSIIGEKVSEIRMNQLWEYSNGCVEEFVHAMQLHLGIPKHYNLIFFNTKENEESERERMRHMKVYDSSGNPIELEQGLEYIGRAALWIREKGFDSRRIEEAHSLLLSTQRLIKEGFYQ